MLPTSLSARRDMEDHLAKVRGRIEREDLSALELRERYRDTLELLKGETEGNDKHARLTAEADLFKTMAVERSAPEPTSEEVLQDLKDRGKHLEAEGYEHSLKVVRARDAVKASRDELQGIEAELAGMSTSDPGRHALHQKLERQRAAVQEAEQALVDADAVPPPYHAREAQRDALKKEVETLRRSAHDMMKTQQPGLRERGEALQAEADEKEAQAAQLDRINRGLEPPPSEAA